MQGRALEVLFARLEHPGKCVTEGKGRYVMSLQKNVQWLSFDMIIEFVQFLYLQFINAMCLSNLINILESYSIMVIDSVQRQCYDRIV